MARRKRDLVFMSEGPFATGLTDNTISTSRIISPSPGARLYSWGTVTNIAGTGGLNPVLSIVGNGLQDTTGAYGNRLAATITYDLDAAANSTQTAFGGGSDVGAYGKSGVVHGETMDIRVDYTAVANTFATTSASFSVWTLWAL